MGLFGSKPEQVSSKPLRVKKAENNFRLDGGMPRNSKRVGRYRRSLSWDGSMNYRRKYWDAGGLTLRRKLAEPINIKQYMVDTAYEETELLPEVMVKPLGEIPKKLKDPHIRKPKTYGFEIGLLDPPNYVPSVMQLKQLLETAFCAPKEMIRLHEKMAYYRGQYDRFRLSILKLEHRGSGPAYEEEWNQRNQMEKVDYTKLKEEYARRVEISLQKMTKLNDRLYNLKAVFPCLKNAVENCFIVAMNQADLPKDVKILILANLWETTINDCLHTYAQLKMMVFKTKLRLERKMKISRTKEALIANYKCNKDIKVRTDADCVTAKCCNGKCKQSGKVCHRERYLNFSDGEIIMKVSHGKSTIFVPKEALERMAGHANDDPYGLKSLGDTEIVATTLIQTDDWKTTKPLLESMLHEISTSMHMLKFESYEVLRLIYQFRKHIKKMQSINKALGKDFYPSQSVRLPMFSSFHFDSLRAALRHLNVEFDNIPKYIELCEGVNETNYPDARIRDEETIERLLSKIPLPTSAAAKPVQQQVLTTYRDLRSTNTWTYFQQEVLPQ